MKKGERLDRETHWTNLSFWGQHTEAIRFVSIIPFCELFYAHDIVRLQPCGSKLGFAYANNMSLMYGQNCFRANEVLLRSISFVFWFPPLFRFLCLSFVARAIYSDFHGLLLPLCLLSHQFICGQTVTAEHNLSRTHLNFSLCKMSLVSYNVTNLNQIKSLRMWRNYSLCCSVIGMPHISVSGRILSIDSFLFRAVRHSKLRFLLHLETV